MEYPRCWKDYHLHICVHVACRKIYTRDTSIESLLNPSPQKAKSLRSALQPFDFNLNCLFCGEECDTTADQRKPSEMCVKCEALTAKKQLRKQRNVALMRGGTLLEPVHSVFDLVAAEGKYHNSCYEKFY